MDLNGLVVFFRKHPYSSNVLFSFVMVGLGKAAEYEFECPCTEGFAWAFFLSYLLMPMFISVVFGLYLLNCQCKLSSKNNWKFFSCVVPSFVWLALFFSDGRYLACLQTAIELTAKNTTGTERVTDHDNPYWLLCDRNQTLAMDQPNVRRKFYISKLCGFAVFIIISIVALCYKCCKERCKFLIGSDEVPCCSAHGRKCGSAHCRKCCPKHKQTCCSEHKNIPCLAHPVGELEEVPLNENPAQTSNIISPCASTKTCICLCHQICDCECHKP